MIAQQIWDTVLMLSHLVYSSCSTVKGLCSSQSFEQPGSMESSRRHFIATFPATLKKLQQQPIEQTLADFRAYLLGAADTFNRAHFFMIVQAVVLVYYPSMALGIIYQEYQTEIALQQMAAAQPQHVDEDADEMEAEPDEQEQAEPQQQHVMRSVDDVTTYYRYSDMNATQLFQSMSELPFHQQPAYNMTMMNSGQESTVFARFMQMIQYVIEQLMSRQSEQQYLMNMMMQQQPQCYDMQNEPRFMMSMTQQQPQAFCVENARECQDKAAAQAGKVKIVIKIEISGAAARRSEFSEIDTRSQEVEVQAIEIEEDQPRRRRTTTKNVVTQQIFILF